uniref:Inosine/uridine-preferring nucleoside hydrolase domain-containing protein n=1 Tax=Oncorhynchus tshawytscha TaxID=74940 RepID=A0A8C8HG64_ONCTS
MSHFNVTAVLTVIECTSKRSRIQGGPIRNWCLTWTRVDDAQAIMMALAAPNVEVQGITCVRGNASLEITCVRSELISIPVFGGTAEPLMGHPLSAGSFHGQDGLGDAPDPDALGLELLQTEGAVIRLVNENPGEVGPVYNEVCLALAVKIDPTLPQKLKGLFIMGGNTDCKEFNFAADIVLNRFFCPTYIATWEFCCENKLPWVRTQVLPFYKDITYILASSNTVATCACYQREMTAGPGFVSCDSYAMVAAINDGFVWVSEPVAVTVELQGTYTRGNYCFQLFIFYKIIGEGSNSTLRNEFCTDRS